jgi:RNA polymerase sigma-70 factor (ECF subfamily)
MMLRQDAQREAELRASLAIDLDGAFEGLVRAYQDRLFAFSLRITGSRRDAEEAAQDAFVRAYRALRTYDSERICSLALRPWLYQIALNVCRNRLRGVRRAEVSLDRVMGEDEDESGSLDPPDPSEGPDLAAERDEERTHLAHLVSTLPERYRAAVVLRFVEGLSYAEVAAALDQPVGTAKANVHRGIKLLRSLLAEHDGWRNADVGNR